MTTAHLPKEIMDSIVTRGEGISSDSHEQIFWEAGAISEATRAQPLVEALEHIAKGTHNGETVYQFALRVQNIAIDVLQRYKKTTA